MRTLLHTLRRAPLHAWTILLTLLLGLTAAGAIWTVVHGVLLAPLPWAAPERLVTVDLHTTESSRLGLTPALWLTVQRHARHLEHLTLYRSGTVNLWAEHDGGSHADAVMATWTTASLLPLLQTTPLLGRGFSADEELRGGPDAVILSEAEWRSRYGGATDVLGRILVINSVPRTIIGVMPASFGFPASTTRIWLPVKRAASGTLDESLYAGVARLPPGRTPAQAQDELAALLLRMAEAFPLMASGVATQRWLAEVQPRPRVQRLHEALTAGVAPPLRVLAVAAALLLAATWANVLSLTLIRVEARQRDAAVHALLGAGWRHAAGRILAELSGLGLLAGIAAGLAVWALIHLLVAWAPMALPRLTELRMTWQAAAGIGVSVMAGVLVCTAVAVGRERRISLAQRLKTGGHGPTTDRGHHRIRMLLTVAQLAIALVFLLGSFLLQRSAHRLQEVRPGFDATQVWTLRLLLPLARYRAAGIVDFYADLTERARQLPFVRAAAVVHHLPLTDSTPLEQSYTGGTDTLPQSLPVNVSGAGYFTALGIPVLAGRDFHRLGVQSSAELILSHAALKRLYGDLAPGAAVGRHIRLSPSGLDYRIVGVVGDVHQSDLAAPPTALVYHAQATARSPALEAGPRSGMALVVKTTAAPEQVLPALRQVVHELDPSVPITELRPLDEIVLASVAPLTLSLALLRATAIITGLLGLLGLYGAMAYQVQLRTRELGIRKALGAPTGSLALHIVGRGLSWALGGIAAGLLLWALAAPALGRFLYGVSPTDPAVLAGGILLLTLVAIAACWIPARTAARLDPAHAFRAD